MLEWKIDLRIILFSVGLYYHISKRAAGIRYVFIGKPSNQRPRWSSNISYKYKINFGIVFSLLSLAAGRNYFSAVSFLSFNAKYLNPLNWRLVQIPNTGCVPSDSAMHYCCWRTAPQQYIFNCEFSSSDLLQPQSKFRLLVLNICKIFFFFHLLDKQPDIVVFDGIGCLFHIVHSACHLYYNHCAISPMSWVLESKTSVKSFDIVPHLLKCSINLVA